MAGFTPGQPVILESGWINITEAMSLAQDIWLRLSCHIMKHAEARKVLSREKNT